MTRVLPRSFTRQGSMLFDALLADLGALPGVEVCTMATLDAPGTGGTQPARSFDERFAACMQAADAVWPLAPESNGVLESISRRVLLHNKILLGSTPAAESAPPPR